MGMDFAGLLSARLVNAAAAASAISRLPGISQEDGWHRAVGDSPATVLLMPLFVVAGAVQFRSGAGPEEGAIMPDPMQPGAIKATVDQPALKHHVGHQHVVLGLTFQSRDDNDRLGSALARLQDHGRDV